MNPGPLSRAADPAARAAHRPLRVGDRLPALEMTDGRSDARVQWRAPSRGSPVVVFLASTSSGEDPAYLESLAVAMPAFRLWGGRPIAVVADAESARTPVAAAAPFPVVVDADGGAARRCGVETGQAALFIADRWGQVYHAAYAESARGLPGSDEIEEWLRFIATQCPECGVPDDPGRGEWTR